MFSHDTRTLHRHRHTDTQPVGKRNRYLGRQKLTRTQRQRPTTWQPARSLSSWRDSTDGATCPGHGAASAAGRALHTRPEVALDTDSTSSTSLLRMTGTGGSRCSDNRYSDNRAVDLGLISVFDHHGRKQLGLSTSSTKVFTRLLRQQSDVR